MMTALERTDQQILALLARNGRMSFTDLGWATGLSTSAAQQRVRRLEQRGVITGYHADLSAEALDRDLTAIISVHALNPRADDDIQALLAGMPEITTCYSIAGDASVLCIAQVGNTTELDGLLSQIRHQIAASTTTIVALTTYFRDRPLVDEP